MFCAGVVGRGCFVCSWRTSGLALVGGQLLARGRQSSWMRPCIWVFRILGMGIRRRVVRGGLFDVADVRIRIRVWWSLPFGSSASPPRCI